MFMNYIYIILAFTFNAVANILLKAGAKNGFNLVSLNPFNILYFNWKFILGFLFFSINAIFYFLALRNMPISIAYPIMVVMSFVIINSYAFLFFGESITSLQIVGYILIVIGLVLVMTSFK